MNKYTLVYPDGRQEKIVINKTLSVGERILGNQNPDTYEIKVILHHIVERTFDGSLTHDVQTFVDLG